MDQYLGKLVKLCSTGITRNRWRGGSFIPHYYTKEERCVYGKVRSWNDEWDIEGEAVAGGPEISRLLPKDSISGSTALLPVNLGVEFTVEEISEKDYPDVRSKLEQGYEVEGDYDGRGIEEFKKLVSFNS